MSRVRFSYPEGAEAWVRSLPEIVSDRNVARGLCAAHSRCTTATAASCSGVRPKSFM